MSAVDGDVLLAGHPIRRYRSLTCWTGFDLPSHDAHSIEAPSKRPVPCRPDDSRIGRRRSPIHDDGLIYMATDEGIVSAVVAAAGQRVWRDRIPGVYMASR
jgi:hypothetical protein